MSFVPHAQKAVGTLVRLRYKFRPEFQTRFKSSVGEVSERINNLLRLVGHGSGNSVFAIILNRVGEERTIHVRSGMETERLERRDVIFVVVLRIVVRDLEVMVGVSNLNGEIAKLLGRCSSAISVRIENLRVDDDLALLDVWK